ncbi:hypothetical protein WR25_02088 [Diploscapter pachys]|uniref:Uncharacterized protein n=1 Tax=Diploscapter pachys TaxID=2018661 RepID=A0A2A2K6F8_9BILA|nr:hypothetical protein WR25_02088 [Diploscapter pachys]
MASSLSSSRGRERSREKDPKEHRQFAFGSSTPRDLSHLSKIPPQLRKYDAKPEIDRTETPLRVYIQKARSLTREKNNAAAPPNNRQPMISPKKAKKRVDKDEISSEPDFIQDREEFIAEIRKKQAEIQESKKINEVKPVQAENKNKQERIATEESEARQNHAVEVSAPIGHERAAINIHEEGEEMAAENLKQEGNQQLISELADEFEDDEGGDKPKRKETLVKNLLRKVEGAVEESLPEATEILNDVQQTARATVVDVEKNVSELLNRASQVFDDSTKQPE